MRVLAVLLAFGAGLAVFAATRAGAPAAPSRHGAGSCGRAPPVALRDAVRARRPGQRDSARRRVPPEGARDGRPRLPGARRDAAAPRAGARPARRRRGRRARHAGRLAPRLPPGPGARPPRAGARPRLARHYPLLVDALVELGRFRAAERALQRFADLRPGLPAYARVSYLRELHGDLAGAARRDGAGRRRRRRRARERRRRPGAPRRPRGGARAARARAARDYAEALAGVPGFPPALAGRARLAAARGDMRPRSPRCAASSSGCRCPSTRSRSASCELAAGRPAAARRTFALVGAERRLLAGGGVDTDAELAVFEADHGSPRRAVALGPPRRGPRRPGSAPPTRSAGR